MSTQERKKAWFVEGLRLLPDKIRLIEMQHGSSLLASRRCLEKADGDIMASSSSYRNHPDVKAWHAYRDDIVTELDAAVRIGGEFGTSLRSCRKLSIALSQGFYRDESQLILDAISEVTEVTEMMETLDCENEPEREDDALHKQALGEWNSGATWKNISEKLTGEPESSKSFSQAVKRYAKRNSLNIRIGVPGTKSNRNE